MLKSSSLRRDRKRSEKKSSSYVKSIATASTGCMSGLFQLFQYHHGRSRKRLASGAKKEKNLNSSEKPTPLLETKSLGFDLALESEDTKELRGTALEKTTLKNELRRRRSCEDAPRSPTIKPEIRQSTCSMGSPTTINSSPRCPPAIIARLMGLNENVPATITRESSPETASEKRRRLLGALEKCDEDLRTIKRIIDAARDAHTKKILLSFADKEIDVVKSCIVQEQVVDKNKCSELVMISSDDQLQRSPVSVVKAISSPLYKPRRFNKGLDHCAKRTKHELPCKKGKLLDQLGFTRRRLKSELETRSSAMVENVVEVLEEAFWEEKWEMSRIYLGFEDYILHCLVEELVTELIGRFCYKLTCRKRLLL